MAASDLIPDLQDAVAGFQTTVAGKQTTIDGKKASGETAASNAHDSKDSTVALKDVVKRALDGAYADARSAVANTSAQDLDAVADTKSDTAIDVIVYDTSKDSDGGAWRYRTQHTSWYNEPLNTTTRGARREFPSVAIVVVKNGLVTIYDADDPALPMWMVFEAGSQGQPDGTHWKFIISGGLSSGAMFNGMLVVGRYSLNVCDFVGDRMEYIGPSAGGSGPYDNAAVDKRNAFNLITGGLKWLDINGHALESSNLNDVAITTLPDAPIDPVTGLPVPTIAVAANGGVSIIKDDGTVVDIRNGDNVNHAKSVAFTSDNKIACQLYDQQRGIRIFDIPSSDVTQGNHYTKGSALEWYEGVSNEGSTHDGDLDIDTINLGNTNVNIGHSLNPIDINKTLYLSKPNGLTAVHRNPSSPSSGAVASVASDHTTGWMVGDIKGAFLSDTDDTNITDSLFNSNSSFNTNVTGVTTFSGATISHDTGGDGGRLKVTSDGTQYCGVFIDYSTAIESGKTYLFQIDYAVGTYTGNVNLSANGQNTSPSPNFSTSGTYRGYLTSTYSGTASRQLRIRFQDAHTAGEYFFVDNVIIKEVELDRSFNKNSLIVNGTITKDPVATGAELVSYSGFSPTNYLQQEYNSDLDFGTGDFCVMGWVQESAASDWIVDRMEGRDGSSNLWGFNIFQSTQSLRFDVYENNANTSVVSTTAMGNDDSVWYFFTAVRRNGVLEMYMQGSLEATTSGTARNISYTSTGNAPPLIIGGRNTVPVGSSWLNGKAALIRISATAPTAEQIAKIYNDERHLFQENAKCTLYGTSDDVNALAYDEDAELLHVGTSGGRSVFKGLQRVDNTTTAVSTALSASNGLLVEE